MGQLLDLLFAIALPRLDLNALGAWGSFAVGAVAVLVFLGGLYGVKAAVRYIQPKLVLERDRAQAFRERDQATSEAGSARKEAESARNEAGSWKSAHDELAARVEYIEKRLIPKFNAALKLIRALLEYIGHLEDAMSHANVQFPVTMHMPDIPIEISDDINPI